jgi:hypothetical protein
VGITHSPFCNILVEAGAAAALVAA